MKILSVPTTLILEKLTNKIQNKDFKEKITREHGNEKLNKSKNKLDRQNNLSTSYNINKRQINGRKVPT